MQLSTSGFTPFNKTATTYSLFIFVLFSESLCFKYNLRISYSVEFYFTYPFIILHYNVFLEFVQNVF